MANAGIHEPIGGLWYRQVNACYVLSYCTIAIRDLVLRSVVLPFACVAATSMIAAVEKVEFQNHSATNVKVPNSDDDEVEANEPPKPVTKLLPIY